MAKRLQQRQRRKKERQEESKEEKVEEQIRRRVGFGVDTVDAQVMSRNNVERKKQDDQHDVIGVINQDTTAEIVMQEYMVC